MAFARVPSLGRSRARGSAPMHSKYAASAASIRRHASQLEKAVRMSRFLGGRDIDCFQCNRRGATRGDVLLSRGGEHGRCTRLCGPIARWPLHVLTPSPNRQMVQTLGTYYQSAPHEVRKSEEYWALQPWIEPLETGKEPAPPVAVALCDVTILGTGDYST